MIGPATEPNPHTIPLRGVDVHFEVFDHAGSPAPNVEIDDRFRAMGLNCGYRVEIAIRARRISFVALKLIHFANPPTVEAFGRGNLVESGTMDADQGAPQLITLSGQKQPIDQVVITASADETALLELCIG